MAHDLAISIQIKLFQLEPVAISARRFEQRLQLGVALRTRRVSA